uniref:Uncharacterized protein n=1 Tax=Arundo donax TaxID=35708 RepID=A0A0A9B4P4_ARUDO
MLVLKSDSSTFICTFMIL